MTSVPPTQPPAADETDVRLTEAIERGLRKCRVEDAPVSLIKEHDLFHVTHMVAAELSPLLAERVRGFEGERDAAHEAGYWVGYREGKDEAETRDLNYDEATARAESAEAAHAALVAAVGALADKWDRGGISHDLRALIAREG